MREAVTKENLAKLAVWAPYYNVPRHIFLSETLSIIEKMTLCYIYTKQDRTVYQKYISWDLGIGRRQVLKVCGVLETKQLISVIRYHDNRSPNQYKVPEIEHTSLMVPLDIICDKELTCTEKYVCLALHNRDRLKMKGDIKQAARLLGMSRTTLIKTLNTLHGFKILLTPSISLPKRKKSWEITNRINHKEKTNMQWKKHIEEKKQPKKLTPPTPVEAAFLQKLRQNKINKNILFVSELIFARRNAPPPQPTVCGIVQPTWLDLNNDNAAPFLPAISACA